jgi:hypothetical protein
MQYNGTSFVDNSPTPATITTTGSPSVDTLSPFTIPSIAPQTTRPSVINNNLISKKDYEMNAKNIQMNYETLKQLRNELDVNMDTLYKSENSVLNDYKMEYEGSIYTGILWTIIASSVLFYFFTESE